MKATKTLLSIAVIAALPITTMAEINYVGSQTPAYVGNNGLAIMTTSGGPYATIEPTAADESHIASTAYVKGAYNDTIAAINYVDFQVQKKQEQLGLYDSEDEETIGYMLQDVQSSLNDVDNVFQLVNGMAVKNAVNAVDTKIDNQRVTIYTTWDDDSANATMQVELSTAQ